MKSFKISILLFLTLNYYTANCQNANCDIIEKSTNTTYFKKEFLVCNNDSVVLLFDKKNILKECKEFNVCSKKIKVNNDTINNLSPEKFSSYKPKNLIILYDYVQVANKHIIYYWRPYSGANIILTFKIKKGKFKLIKYSIGTF